MDATAIRQLGVDVIERENLVENGRTTGEYMRAGLRKLMKKHSLIGDVRGYGLMQGVEMVRDRLAPGMALDDFIRQHIDDGTLRAERSKALGEGAIPASYARRMLLDL